MQTNAQCRHVHRLLSLFLFLTASAAWAEVVPLYQLYASATTDYFYTISASDRDYAQSIGFTYQRIVGWIERTQVPGTLPFRRFYAGPPQTDHFYSSFDDERDFVLANGWAYETNEGYIYAARVSGTLALHRLSYFDPSSGDLAHYYTLDEQERDRFLAQGWTYDRIAGYITPNGNTLTFRLGETPYAENYIRYFPYGSTQAFSEAVTTPNNSNRCNSFQAQRPGCAPNLPSWRGNSIFGDYCFSLALTSHTVAHARAQIGDAQPTFFEGRPVYVVRRQQCSGIGNPDGICYIYGFSFRLLTADPIGSLFDPPNYRCGSGETFAAYSNGPASRELFPGELTPDGWGAIPHVADVNVAKFQIIVPPGKRVVSNGVPSIDVHAGDVYWLQNPVQIEVSHDNSVFGGGDGPNCWPGASQCIPLAPRAKASLVNGTWAVTITGYGTADNLQQNTADYFSDLNMLAGVGTPNPTVAAVIQWLRTQVGNWDNIIIYGHSLGAADAIAIYNYFSGPRVVTFAAPAAIPAEAMLPRPFGIYSAYYVAHYSGINDIVSNPYSVPGCTFNYLNACRQSAGVNLFPLNTGAGFLTGNNPHDRCLYEGLTIGGCPF